jgi:membrane-associated protease RseP (regulator of RpoE activity)
MTMRLMMANVSISYLREGRYPGVLRVGTGMSGIGRTSFRLAQVLVQETCIGIAESVTVHVVNGASAPLPDNLKAALAAFQVGDRIEDPTEKVLEAGTKARILIADNESDWMSAHSFRIGRRT